MASISRPAQSSGSGRFVRGLDSRTAQWNSALMTGIPREIRDQIWTLLRPEGSTVVPFNHDWNSNEVRIHLARRTSFVPFQVGQESYERGIPRGRTEMPFGQQEEDRLHRPCNAPAIFPFARTCRQAYGEADLLAFYRTNTFHFDCATHLPKYIAMLHPTRLEALTTIEISFEFLHHHQCSSKNLGLTAPGLLRALCPNLRRLKLDPYDLEDWLEEGSFDLADPFYFPRHLDIAMQSFHMLPLQWPQDRNSQEMQIAIQLLYEEGIEVRWKQDRWQYGGREQLADFRALMLSHTATRVLDFEDIQHVYLPPVQPTV